MSGYLQRIVSQAKGAGPDPGSGSGIRPLVRPMFSSPDAPAFGEVHEEGSAAVAGLPHGERFRSQAPASIESRSASGTAEGGEPHLADGSRPSIRASADAGEQSQRFAPLMPETGQGERPDLTRISSERTEMAGKGADKATDRAADVPAVIRIAEAPREQMPLMPRQARPAALPVAAAAVPPPPAGDEIHINIGRIEVTAVPQAAAPRPAPRAPRRAFSLEDYLRKTDGRS